MNVRIMGDPPGGAGKNKTVHTVFLRPPESEKSGAAEYFRAAGTIRYTEQGTAFRLRGTGYRREYFMEETDRNPYKVYVDVTVRFNRNGIVSPVSFVWEDGATYDIDRVINVRRAASNYGGGTGIMFTCMIEGRKSHLFYEENNRWFMEKK